MRLVSLDHIVLTVRDLDSAVAFYRDILGMEEVVFGGGRRALHFGMQKINLHETNSPISPKASAPTVGGAHLCFLIEDMNEVISHLSQVRVVIEEGPVYRTGASSPLLSIYVRDPDGNLIELSQPQNVVIAPNQMEV
ncbi:VOC family protein [Rhodobacteraceae bacterium RKSG542]|uniref:VOC family protein n=1 Tax=Pseudovibrio flavus TaxID=2529854 RepID=UPI0012BC7DE9|nr:VOC family protein [Pseudovibrio flavus]MTI16700.1 VOC family protein [Pseudovibrio flavus]